jgi:dihydropteroate synthase-like protein
VILPGYCRGELDRITVPDGTRLERGPKDLRDLPDFFGKQSQRREGYGAFDIEILAEINHAPNLSREELLRQAELYRRNGADLIDLGCNPGQTWAEIGEATRQLVEAGYRVSVDSFNAVEVEAALQNGAELVLSVNGTNRDQVQKWQDLTPHLEVVVIPDSPTDLASLHRSIDWLDSHEVSFRIDPILEPIAFGFARSLGRYLEVRQRYPDQPMMMGIGNLTELTDVDSAGINVVLAGFCQEQQIRSVLTTEVINWCRSSVKEFDLARRLVYHAVNRQTLPKHLEPELLLLRDPKLHQLGELGLKELAERVTDRNYRIFIEQGEIHLLNASIHLHGTDPFSLFEELQRHDTKLDSSHSFYLGYELAKAITALTLGKNYTQDQALRWGFLTVPERSHRGE